MTPELMIIGPLVCGVSAITIAVVGMCAIVSQAKTIRRLVKALADENRNLIAASLVDHPSHKAQIAKLLIAEVEPPGTAPDDTETGLDVHKGVVFTEGG